MPAEPHIEVVDVEKPVVEDKKSESAQEATEEEPTESVILYENVTESYDENTLRPTANKCRADDTVRCSDGSRYICSVQQCDGMPDCDDGGDEVGCAHPGKAS